MSTIQTKIQFVARKRFVASSVKKTFDEKENCMKNIVLKTPVKSPSKLENVEKDRRFLLEVNSPTKRNYQSPDINSVPSGEC